MHEASFKGVGGPNIFTRSWLPAVEEPRAGVVIVHRFNSHSSYYTASRLAEFSTELTDGQQFVAVLAERLAQYGATTWAAINTAAEDGDQSTADLFTEISRTVDKQRWFLEGHLQS